MVIRPVLKGFFSDNGGDVAIGIFENQSLGNFYYSLCRTPMEINDSVHTYAYPETEHADNRIDFFGKYYEGKIEAHYPDGRDKNMLPSSCYQTSIRILGGASGGPVFNSKGSVIGINSTSFDAGHDEASSISFVSDINDVFNIPLHGIDLPCGFRERITIEELCHLDYIKIKNC